MEMSQELLIDFGLNLAGYLVVVILAYILFRLPYRQRKTSQTAVRDELTLTSPKQTEAKPVAHSSRPSAKSQPDYIELAQMKVQATEHSKQTVPIGAETTTNRRTGGDAVFSRRNNRREIYNQARELLSKGKSSRELLQQLPITEGELEMLSLARKA